ncbi:MAG: hypothetical protein H0U74_16340 [Bradymonadaceae bacterium]|nr:hypothetical protein [Lujinxingiaceae bacterium]
MRTERSLLPNVVVVALVCLLVAGCASSGTRSDSGPPVGDRPTDEDAQFRPPPAGPDVMATGRTSSAVEDAGGSNAGTTSISRARLDAFIAQGPAFVFGEVDAQPLHEGGKFQGFQIVDVTTRAHTAIAPHLRVGDVVTHVNGIRLKLPDDYLQAWKGLGQAQSVRVDFMREGEKQHVTWIVE